MAATFGQGQGDTNGSYLTAVGALESNFTYIGDFQPVLAFVTTPPPAFNILNSMHRSYPFPTWMKNVWILPREVWINSLSQPYQGQLYPVPNTGGAQTGQTYPF
ncbi:Uncharacterised protein [uncultured archaeon]|nr:Uncharacterised protein [uncultured archaeon]